MKDFMRITAWDYLHSHVKSIWELVDEYEKCHPYDDVTLDFVEKVIVNGMEELWIHVITEPKPPFVPKTIAGL